jgi:hypothetical protein
MHIKNKYIKNNNMQLALLAIEKVIKMQLGDKYEKKFTFNKHYSDLNFIIRQ